MSSAAAGLGTAIHATACAVGNGCNFRQAAVMTPKVPSEPMNRCLRSRPVLFLRSRYRPSQICPSGNTTSSPRTFSRVLPKRNTPVPPALVAILPPIWQDPSAPRLTGYSRRRSLAACCTAASTQPASTTIESLAVSMARTARMRARLMSIGAAPSGHGTEPPHRLVLPPCASTGTRNRPAMRTAAATCCVQDGSTTQAAGPPYRPRQSCRYPATSASETRTACAPSAVWSCATKDIDPSAFVNEERMYIDRHEIDIVLSTIFIDCISIIFPIAHKGIGTTESPRRACHPLPDQTHAKDHRGKSTCPGRRLSGLRRTGATRRRGRPALVHRLPVLGLCLRMGCAPPIAPTPPHRPLAHPL